MLEYFKTEDGKDLANSFFEDLEADDELMNVDDLPMDESLLQELIYDTQYMLNNLGITRETLNKYLEETGEDLGAILYSESANNRFIDWLKANNYEFNEYHQNDEYDDLDDMDEALNQIDLQNDNEYDLRTLFRSKKIDENKASELRSLLKENDAKKIYEYLYDDEDDFEDEDWEEVAHKSVQDFDGFYTDYTMYKMNDGRFICIFGDNELYDPSNANPDFETDNEREANEWFDSYEGAAEPEFDMFESLPDDSGDDLDYALYSDIDCGCEAHAFYSKRGQHDFVGVEDSICTDDKSEIEAWAWDKLQHGMYVMINCGNEFHYFNPEKFDRDCINIYDCEE